MSKNDKDKKKRIAQWAFDTRPILGRFHLWLEDVREEWIRGMPNPGLKESISFMEDGLERLMTITAAVTALGTRLFGRFGEGATLDKMGLNHVKKDADAISAYAMSESLWYLSRSLPENHAIMVCLGEGLMPKAGEAPEMGSNPMLGFGRIYARPQVAKYLENCVNLLINDDNYRWENFRSDLHTSNITVWGAAIDTLENTSRFAQGKDTGPLTVLHIFDQPLSITRPYEGYIGNLVLPKEVVQNAAEKSILIDFFTPRRIVLEAIKDTYSMIKSEHVHVWTLRGKSRAHRIGKLWKEWEELGVDLMDNGWRLPTGGEAFTDSGTYAPTFLVGTWNDPACHTHLMLIDGYAGSAEAIQAASLVPILNLDVSLALFSSKFELNYEQEARIMHLDPYDTDFTGKLSDIFGTEVGDEKSQYYRSDITLAKDAGIPCGKRTVYIDDFLPEKKWQVMAISGYMLDDPYTGAPGVKQTADDVYEVTVRLSTNRGDKRITFALRLLENFEESRLVFNPLLNRFMRGENYKERAVKVSDSGRIRNELQTLCSEALEHFSNNEIILHFDQISEDVISSRNKKILREVLEWYRQNYPIWFNWLKFG